VLGAPRPVEAAEIWFEENDLEGVAFEYDVIGPSA
jgi:hypothetical protein